MKKTRSGKKEQAAQRDWMMTALLAWETAAAVKARGHDADPLDILAALLKGEEPAKVT